MNTYPRDFTGTPFVLGSIRGERCWDVGDDGELISPAFPKKWVDGENTSLCEVLRYDWDNPRVVWENLGKHKTFTESKRYITKIHASRHSGGIAVEWKSEVPVRKTTYNPYLTDMYSMGYENKPTVTMDTYLAYDRGVMDISWNMLREMMSEIAEDHRKNHKFADCSCGFYAYLNGINDYLTNSKKPRVVGIVEGYGETLIGTRGFRAQKAKILALAPTVSLSKAIKDVDAAELAVAMSAPVPPPPPVVIQSGQASWLQKLFAKGGGNGSPTYFKNGNYVVATGRMNGKAATIHHLYNAGILQIPANVNIPEESEPVHVIDWDSIRAAYPSVVFFDDPDKMRMEFPATDVEEVTDGGTDVSGS